MRRDGLVAMVLVVLMVAGAAGCSPATISTPPGSPPTAGQPSGAPTASATLPGERPGATATLPSRPTDDGSQVIDSFEACVRAGNPVMESYPRQCRTANGQSFTEDVQPVATALVATVEPEDPSSAGLYAYPDEPLGSVPATPTSISFLVEHRSALNGKTVRLRGVVVTTLLGEKACPPDRGMCAQPSLFLADTDAQDRDPNYDVRVLVGEREQEADYPPGKLVDIPVMVQADRTALILQKVY